MYVYLLYIDLILKATVNEPKLVSNIKATNSQISPFYFLTKQKLTRCRRYMNTFIKFGFGCFQFSGHHI